MTLFFMKTSGARNFRKKTRNQFGMGRSRMEPHIILVISMVSKRLPTISARHIEKNTSRNTSGKRDRKLRPCY